MDNDRIRTYDELEDDEKNLYKKSASREKIINFIIENI